MWIVMAVLAWLGLNVAAVVVIVVVSRGTARGSRGADVDAPVGDSISDIRLSGLVSYGPRPSDPRGQPVAGRAPRGRRR